MLYSNAINPGRLTNSADCCKFFEELHLVKLEMPTLSGQGLGLGWDCVAEGK